MFDPPENVEKADVKNDYVGSEELTNIYCPIESATEDVSEFDDGVDVLSEGRHCNK